MTNHFVHAFQCLFMVKDYSTKTKSNKFTKSNLPHSVLLAFSDDFQSPTKLEVNKVKHRINTRALASKMDSYDI